MSELASGHQALLTASSDHRRVATQAWVRAARRRQEKVVTIALPLDDGSGEPGSGRSALGDPTAALPVTPIAPDQMYSAGGPADLVQRALAEGFRGLSIVVCGDCVIDSYSAEVHADIEAGLAELCGRHPVSALCVFDRGAGRLDAALTRHPDGLRAQLVDIRRTGDTLAVAGEIDESNSEVLSSALRHAAETSAPTMCLDLSRLRFLSAAGVSALAGGTAAYRAGGGRVELRDATPHIARVLWLLHVDSLPGFELVASGS